MQEDYYFKSTRNYAGLENELEIICFAVDCGHGLQIRAIGLKHGIGKGLLTYWLRERGYGDLKSRKVSLPDMKSVKINASVKNSQQSITELEKELQ